jgi:hypothetical protein
MCFLVVRQHTAIFIHPGERNAFGMNAHVVARTVWLGHSLRLRSGLALSESC